jgi:hypothetical protein
MKGRMEKRKTAGGKPTAARVDPRMARDYADKLMLA